MISKRFILIIVFVAATILLIVPIANAENTPNVFSAIAASEIPLPQLHFNKTQEKMVVTGELSPGKSIRATNGSFTTTIVPIGSIILHANITTTIFDKDGQQVLTADDDKAQIIHTFRGDQLSTFIHEVPNNSVIVDNGNILHVIYDNTRILTIIDDSRLISTPKSSVSALSTTCGGFPYPAKYIQGTESPIISLPGQFSADWNVPSSPTQWKPYIHATPVAIWDGLYGCIEGDPDTT